MILNLQNTISIAIQLSAIVAHKVVDREANYLFSLTICCVLSNLKHHERSLASFGNVICVAGKLNVLLLSSQKL